MSQVRIFPYPKIVIETWRRHFNHVRAHSSLKDLTPVESKASYDFTN